MLKGPCEPAPGAQVALWGRGPGGVLPACRVLPARLTVTTGSLNFCAEWRSSPFPAPCGPGPASWRTAAQACRGTGFGRRPVGCVVAVRCRRPVSAAGLGGPGTCPQPPGLCRENPSTPNSGGREDTLGGERMWTVVVLKGDGRKPVCFACICKRISLSFPGDLGVLVRCTSGIPLAEMSARQFSVHSGQSRLCFGGSAAGGEDRV